MFLTQRVQWRLILPVHPNVVYGYVFLQSPQLSDTWWNQATTVLGAFLDALGRAERASSLARWADPLQQQRSGGMAMCHSKPMTGQERGTCKQRKRVQTAVYCLGQRGPLSGETEQPFWNVRSGFWSCSRSWCRAFTEWNVDFIFWVFWGGVCPGNSVSSFLQMFGCCCWLTQLFHQSLCEMVRRTNKKRRTY